MTVLIFIVSQSYEHYARACVNGKDLVLHKEKSLAKCSFLCSLRTDCLSFEYGVAHGGGTLKYKENDCILQSGTVQLGCNGAYNNLDLYVKKGNENPRNVYKINFTKHLVLYIRCYCT